MLFERQCKWLGSFIVVARVARIITSLFRLIVKHFYEIVAKLFAFLLNSQFIFEYFQADQPESFEAQSEASKSV